MNQTLEQLQTAVTHAETPLQTVTALHELADYFATFDFQEAIVHLNKAQEIVETHNLDPKLSIPIFKQIGSLFNDLRNNEAAIHYLEKAAALTEAHHENVQKASILRLLGFVQMELGNFTEALSYYLQALELSRREENLLAEAEALSGIGLVYGEMGNSEQALRHLNQVLTLKEAHNLPGVEFALNNCALEYVKIGEFAQALAYGQRALAITLSNNNLFSAVFARNRIGEGYMGLGQLEQAVTYFQQNLDFLQTESLKPRRLHSLWNLGKLCILQHRYPEAVKHLEESLEIAKSSAGKQFIFEVYEKLAEAYKGMGNFERALHCFQQFHKLKEIVFDEKSKQARHDLEVAYRTEAAHREAELLQQKAKELEREIQERKRAEEQALQASQAKSRFLATMSHELRTPLNSIIGFAELIELELTEQQNLMLVEDVQRIHKNGLHLLELVNEVLDMAKIETGKLVIYPERASPWLIVHEVADVVARSAKNGVEFIVIADPELPEFIVDTMRIKQVLLNLLSNAFKFTDEGWVKLTAEATAVSIQFIVEDNGIGIPADQMSALFETFTQVDTPKNRTLRGTGLGLPIARDLIQLHGGSIAVESIVGQGSKFVVTLPRNLSESDTPDE
ncbi:MAG: tetratricopeptide repeat-containing sensor histidine kinase [Ardenticatenaceae bacterium]|nr:tetratricopeptide repeat-containing sensor histidine kinase [Ardenticatenaceae bacterium]